MRYDIRMTIGYDFDAPAAAARNLLRVMPATIPGVQRCITSDLTIDPAPGERREGRDFFGNATTEVVLDHPHQSLEFHMRARVERLAVERGLDVSPPVAGLHDHVAEAAGLAPDAPHHFLGASARIAAHDGMAAYAAEKVAQAPTTFAAIEALGRALFGDMKFDAEATSVDTPAAAAFENRHGVCQDFTHIMITCLRSLGVPAGYVSGFLRTVPPKGQDRLEGADAMHAWVRAWCGRDMGWVEFDPTNALWVAEDHVVIAYGRDYSDVAPVRGVMRTAGAHRTDQAVDVLPLGV